MELLIFVALIALATLSAGTILVVTSPGTTIKLYLGVMLIAISAGTLGTLAQVSYKYVSAIHIAKILNDKHETTYTASDIFFAPNVIDELNELKRSRIDMRSHISREKPELGTFYQQRD